MIYYSKNLLNKFPKSKRFDLCNDIKNLLYEKSKKYSFWWKAYTPQEKFKYLRETDVNLVVLKSMVTIAYKYQYISQKKLHGMEWQNQWNRKISKKLDKNMPKSINNIFYEKLKFYKMLAAYERASKNKHKYREVILYEYSKKKKNFYILKCDISKFFYSINKQILFNLIKRYVKDKAFLKLTKVLIYSDNNKVEIPIGNYTSQYFANIYLNKLEHYIKEELKLNKKTNYFKAKQGVNFCGYKIFATHILQKKENKK